MIGNMVVVNRGQGNTYLVDEEFTVKEMEKLAKVLPEEYDRVELYDEQAQLVTEGRRYGQHWVWERGEAYANI